MAAIDDLLGAITQSKAAKAAKDSGEAINSLTHSMNAAKSIGGAFSKVVGTLASVSKIAMAGLGPIGILIGSITQGLLAPIDAIKEMADAIIQLVGLANPGAVQQFTLALNDAMAVIGAAMTPMLEGMTIAMRTVGDTIAGLIPVIQPVFNAIGQFIANWAVGLKGLVEAGAPLIDLLSIGLVDTLADVSIGIATFQGALTELVRMLSDAVMTVFGIASHKNKFDPNASSQGAALRQFKTGSVEQFSKDLFAKQLAVLGKGGQGKTPEQNMEEIRKAVQEGQRVMKYLSENVKLILDWLKQFPETLRSIMNGLTGGLTDMAGGSAGALGGIAGSLIKAMLK